jgi:hypothetical protein
MTIYDTIEFEKWYASNKDKEMPTKSAIKFFQVFKATQDARDFYQEKFISLVKKYAQLDEMGNVVYTDDNQGIALKPDSQSAAEAAINELLGTEVEYSGPKLTWDDLPSQTTPAQISLFSNFI